MTPQNSDRLSLQETLAAMRRIGIAPEEYVVGYEDGLRGLDMDETVCWTDDQLIAYRRGVKAGQEARRRGAHREAS